MPRKTNNKKNPTTKTTSTASQQKIKPSVMPNLNVPHASLASNLGVAPRIPLLN